MTDSPGGAAAAAVEHLRAQGVDTLIVAGCVTYGMMRGKRLPIDQAARAFGHGIALARHDGSRERRDQTELSGET